MTLKDGVKFENTRREIWYAIGVAEVLYKTHGLSLVVTSLEDGQHLETSLHYSGRAVDLRTRNIPVELLRTVHGGLVNILNPLGYDVILEKDHIHIEYDPKHGENWQVFTA